MRTKFSQQCRIVLVVTLFFFFFFSFIKEYIFLVRSFFPSSLGSYESRFARDFCGIRTPSTSPSESYIFIPFHMAFLCNARGHTRTSTAGRTTLPATPDSSVFLLFTSFLFFFYSSAPAASLFLYVHPYSFAFHKLNLCTTEENKTEESKFYL